MKRTFLKERYNKTKEQQRLKEEYGIEDASVVVVEKDNAISQTLRVFFNAVFFLLRTIALILLALLALIGLAGLIYPNIRAEYLVTWHKILTELSSYF